MTQNQLSLESVSFFLVDPNALLRALNTKVQHVFSAEMFS